MSKKIDKAIEVTYQAAGATSGLVDVTMVIYDEGHALDEVNFSNVVMTEIGITGRYYGAFTPDAEGVWTILIDSATTPGKVVKKYTVVAHDVDSVGDVVATTDGKVDTVDGKITALNDVSIVEIDTVLVDYGVAKGSDIVSPPMVG